MSTVGRIITFLSFVSIFAIAAFALPETSQDTPHLDTLEGRIGFVEYLLERYPNILRVNLGFRRNLLDVLNHVNTVSTILGPNANPMNHRAIASMNLVYAPGASVSYNDGKIQDVKIELKNDLFSLH